MGKSLFLDVHELERRRIEFDATFAPKDLSFPDNWRLAEPLRAEGYAELLDRNHTRVIHVGGRIEGKAENSCARCLEPIQHEVKGALDLYFYPMAEIATSEERAVTSDDVDIGFYEEPGLPLADAVREQVSLWLPVRELCREDCKGLCPQCGANLNEERCDCQEDFADSRWDALRKLKLDDNNPS
ncbi:MAG: DUF177 domain-containing protein [Acidobacteria bacterium]|nr:DUF177 domain-containing protein [Acidobacteriota bacterium]